MPITYHKTNNYLTFFSYINGNNICESNPRGVTMNSKSLLFSFSILLIAGLTACSPVAAPATSNLGPGATTAPGVSEPAITTPPLASVSLQAIQQEYEKIYQKVLPSVVNVVVIESATSSSGAVPNSPFGQPNGSQPRATALGSGFLWDTEGHIVTNNHVVNGAASIMVTFADGISKPATVVGTDVNSDLAVIKVEPSTKYVPLQLTDSSSIKIGQIAIAIGEPAGLQGSMAVGIISGLGRSLGVDTTTNSGINFSIPGIIQTDAPISPGNSGGPLVDISGQLIGVTTAIESPSQGYNSIGYAIPANIVKRVVPALISKGSYEHPWLGITGRSMSTEVAQAMKLNPDQRGVLVIDIDPNGPSAKVGLQVSNNQATIYGQSVEVGGDIIIKIDGQLVNNFEDLASYLELNGEVGKPIQLTLLSSGKEVQVNVTLMARPATRATQQPAAAPQNTASRSWLGITGMTLNDAIITAMSLPSGTSGVLIVDVSANSPSSKAGLKAGTTSFTYNGQQIMIGGDVITKFDNVVITSMGQLRSIIAGAQPGSSIKLEIIRNGKTQVVNVTLEAAPVQ